MSKTIKMIKAVVVSMAIMGASMQVDAFGGKASWKEEVLLHDGTKIIVERSQTYGGYPTIDSRERAVLDEEWLFQMPSNGQQVIWKSNKRHPPEGDSLMPMLLGFIDGVPYIATVPAGCITYNHWGRPNPPYVFFKFDGKTWQRVVLAEFPSELKEANVVVGRPDPKNRSGVLSVAVIKDDNRLLEPHLLQIVREPIKGGPTTCEELVYYKGAWVGPGDSIGKRMMDRISKQRNSDDQTNSDKAGGR